MMEPRFKAHLNAIAAASASVLDKAEAEERQRASDEEALLRLPLRDALRKVAARLQAELEAALQEAVERYLAEPITDPETLCGRLSHADFPASEEPAHRVYYVDGVAVLWEGTAEIDREGDELHVERELAQLNPEPLK